MFARQLIAAQKRAALSASRRAFGGVHPPAEHPILGDRSPLLTKWAYTRNTPNSTYGDKFQHPMNYQGHVPVTPTKFSPSNFPGAAFQYDTRVANQPAVYFVSALLTSVVTAYLAAVTTQSILLMNDGLTFSIGQIPNPTLFFFDNFVRLQGGKKLEAYTALNYKNIYETDEFIAQAEKYAQQRQ